MLDFLRYDFGYSWPITRGHLIVFLVFASVGGALPLAGLAALDHDAHLGHRRLGPGRRAGHALRHPDQLADHPAHRRFLASKTGRVVDLGAGSGRATVMVLQARPSVTVTSLDRYTGYYGIDDNTPDRLRANARIARRRATAARGGRRHAAAAVQGRRVRGGLSVAAMDHLRRDDIPMAIAETARVLKPGGEFLFVTINSDFWVHLMMPLAIHGHGGYWGWRANEALWRQRFNDGGFDVVETGTRPAELYLLAKKRALAAAR